MYKKRFIPKNKLLQYDLDTFLYWRFQTSFSYFNNPSMEAQKENNPLTAVTGAGKSLLFGNKAKKFQNSTKFLLSRNVKSKSVLGALLSTGPRLSEHSSMSSPLGDGIKPIPGESVLGFPFLVPRASLRTPQTPQSSRLNGGVENKTPFFPEKKNFMQFWAFPLLGASFLSFLTFENRGFSKPSLVWATPSPNLSTFGLSPQAESPRPSRFARFACARQGNVKTSEILKELNFQKTFPMRFNQTFKEHSTLLKEFYISDMPLIFSNTDKETKQLSGKNSYTEEIQKLCLFYLNLTEEKLLSTFDLQKGENFSYARANRAKREGIGSFHARAEPSPQGFRPSPSPLPLPGRSPGERSGPGETGGPSKSEGPDRKSVV